jgi:LysM repeat protein
MTNEIYAKRIHELEAELARGPRYITNIETKYVAMPDLEQKGGKGLTRPTTIVDPPPEQQQAAVETPKPTPQQQPPRSNPQQETRVASSGRETQRESGTERNGRETPRNTAQRNTGSSGSRSAPEQTSSRVRTVHTVKPGDTLDALARRYGVSASELRAANPGLGRGTRAGQKISIPNK